MELSGLYTVNPHDEDLIVRLTKMAGDAYLEERWMMTLLEGLPPESRGRDRERYLAEAFVLNELAVFAPYQAVYCLENGTALAQAYLKSELDISSEALERKAWDDLVKSVLSDDEAECLTARMDAMKPISNFHWCERDTGDYIHFVFFAVDRAHRGSGAFRQLITPFLDYADEARIPCYLETYSAELEGLYEHFGFTTCERFEHPDFAVVERAMARDPR